MQNLDLLAARTSQKIIADTTNKKATDVNNLVTKALGVLQENGVYAALLYLYSRNASEQFVAQQIRIQLLHLTSAFDLTPPFEKQEKNVEDVQVSDALQFLTDYVCSDLDRLLLVKQLWEQTLIYARYGAKAREAEEKIRNSSPEASIIEKVNANP